MAYGPITSWQIDGEKVEAVVDFIFLGSKITADGNCSHEMKRCLLLGRKAMINLDSILKSRGITLLTKVRRVKALDFPVGMCGCESWTIKKASEVEVDVFLEFLYSLHDLLNVGNLLSHPAAQVASLLTWPSTGLNWCVQIFLRWEA